MSGFAMVTAVFDKTSEIICFFDSEGLIRYINESGKKELKTEALETNIKEILPNFFPKDGDIYSFISDHSSEDIKADAYRKNHSCFPVKMKVFIAENISGKPLGICIMTDIRDYDLQEKQKKKMEDDMKEVMKAQDTFVANLTHELRTPVNGIKGHINNLKADEEDAGKRRTMNIVLNCCENMEKIIDNLLDYAKIENGKMEIQEEKFSLYKLINGCIDTSVSVANEKGLNLKSHIADNVPDEVIGDEFRLSQVINNLINNALKFTSMGQVALEVYKTKQSGKNVELTFFVMDTGIGMSKEDKDKLFKSFTQADGSITRKYGGTGLGLYVCKQIVELMGGHIEVDSEKGKGSTFIFTVNLRSENAGEVENEEITIDDLKNSLVFEREQESKEEMLEYGNPRNLGLLRDLLEKTILCIELDNWMKAEDFAETIKKLTANAPKEVSGLALRLVMNIRKEKKEKCMEYLNELSESVHLMKKAGE
ncbi:MAG: hypothetical protein K5894_03635 [Lachnospiraceae bacterium]|nr:hypothetical protein [Lachnospiraceae bacterium]